MTIEERKAIYQTFCDEGKITSLFNQPWWLESIGSWDVSLGMRNEQVVGAMPFATGRRLGISTIGMPALTHHLRLWMDKPPDVSDHKWLTREKQSSGPSWINFRIMDISPWCLMKRVSTIGCHFIGRVSGKRCATRL